MKKQKVLIDTDIGDDIDDALALALGLELENIEIVGITTVFRDTFARARIARRLLELAGRKDIPVYAGSCDGLCRQNERKPLCQMTAEAKDERYDPCNAEDGEGEKAVDFIIETAKKYGKELAILGIGPYTNLARAFLKDAKAMNGVEKIVVMGGTYFEHHLEWNVLCDVEAADILYSQCKNLHCIGYDVTKQTLVSQIEQREMVKPAQGLRGYLAELTRQWIKGCWHAPILHDPLAMYYLSEPSIVFMKQAEIRVETEGKYTRGMTVNLDNFKEGDPRHQSVGTTKIAAAVDSVAFRAKFMQTLFPDENSVR